MRRRVVATLVATLLAGTVAACADTTRTTAGAGTDNDGSPVTSSPPTVRAVAKDEAALHLWVSNQSFADDPVDLTITIDGIQIIDQPFSVGSQHNWILFPVDAPPGRHVLKAASDTGAELTKAFSLPAHNRRHAVVDYWHYPSEGPAHFTWRVQAKPLIFM